MRLEIVGWYVRQSYRFYTYFEGGDDDKYKISFTNLEEAKSQLVKLLIDDGWKIISRDFNIYE